MAQKIPSHLVHYEVICLLNLQDFIFPATTSHNNLRIYSRFNSESIKVRVLVTAVSTLLHIAGSANQVQFCRVQTRIPVLSESAYKDVSCILYYSQTDDCWNFLERTCSFEGIDCSSVTSAQVRSERGRALWGANMSLHTLETHALIFRTRDSASFSHQRHGWETILFYFLI